jgi:hypothetical protein
MSGTCFVPLPPSRELGHVIGTTVEKHPYTALQSLEECVSVGHAPLICDEAYDLPQIRLMVPPKCQCASVSWALSRHSNRIWQLSKQVHGIRLAWSDSFFQAAPRLPLCIQCRFVGDEDRGTFSCYGKYSIQLDMFLQDLVIQMTLYEELGDGHSQCTEPKLHCNKDLQGHVVLIFIIYILPQFDTGRVSYYGLILPSI